MHQRVTAVASLIVMFSVSVGCAAAGDDTASGSDAFTEKAAGEEPASPAPVASARAASPAPPARGWLSVSSKECGGAKAPVAQDERYLLDDGMFVRAVGTSGSATETCHALNVAQRLITGSQASSSGSSEAGTLVLMADLTRCSSKVDHSSTDTDIPSQEAQTRTYSLRRDAANTAVLLTIEGAAECPTGKLALNLRP